MILILRTPPPPSVQAQAHPVFSTQSSYVGAGRGAEASCVQVAVVPASSAFPGVFKSSL